MGNQNSGDYQSCNVTTSTLSLSSIIAQTSSGNVTVSLPNSNFSYQWLLNNSPIAGANGTSYTIDDATENGSYKLKTKIPFGWLIVSRYMKNEDGMVTVTHDVKFTGMLRKLLGNKIGKRYREMLPSVMGNIKLIAEAEN